MKMKGRNTINNLLWVEKYRPNKIEDCILPDAVKQQAQGMVQSGSMPHLLLSGTAGTGKTTLAKCIKEELGSEMIVYNGSSGELNINELREGIEDYASTVNLDGSDKPKIIFIDEADGLSRTIQGALRHAMEQYNVIFILTCNYPEKILPEIHSRCASIPFNFQKEELNPLAQKFAMRVANILESENVKYDPNGIIGVCAEFFPDNRRILNELQRYASINGCIDADIVKSLTSNVKSLFNGIKEKDFDVIRTWVAENNTSNFFDIVYNEYENHLPKEQHIWFIMCMGKGLSVHNTVPNQELNILSTLAEYISA